MTHRLGVGVFLCLLSFLSVASQAQTITFIDQGAPATVLLDGSTVGVRVTDPTAYSTPARDTVSVTVTSALGADSVTLALLETGPETAVFEGLVELEPNGPGYGYAPSLTTATNPAGPARDTLQATYGSATATATLVGSEIRFLDDWGRESTSFVAGHSVGLRVRDELRNDPLSRDSFAVTVASQASSDSVTVTLQETGMSSGVFEGLFGTTNGGEGSPPDHLVVWLPDVISIDLLAVDGVTSTVAQAQIAASAVVLRDGEGEPAGTFLEAAPVHVLVIAPGAYSSSISVQVTAALSGDVETLTLWSEVGGTDFAGLIPTQPTFAPPTPGDGILQISPYSGPPSQPDTVTVTYTGGVYDPGTSSAGATFVNSRIAFVDARGRETSSYAAGSEAHVRFESQTENTPALDTATVRLKMQGGFNEQYLELVETRRDSGVFTGSMALEQLGVQAGDRIEASYSPDLPMVTADIVDLSLEFLDERGEPTEEIVESGPARVRMVRASGNTSPASAETASVEMRVRQSNDLESLTLTETGPNTGVFEGSMPLEMGSYGNPDGKLQTGNTGPPDYRADEVMARSGAVEATARTIGARIEFVDASGAKVSGYAVGEPVRLRIIDHFKSAYGNSFQVTLVGLSKSDTETLTLQETAPDSGVFEGAIPTELYRGMPAGTDGKLTLDLTDQIEVRHVTGFSPIELTARVAIRGNAIRFLDAAGQPATVYLESSRAFVEVVGAIYNSSPSFVESVQVQIRGEISPDVETLTLTETGPDTGVFRGSIQMQFTLGSYLFGNGILETHEAGSATLHEFDTVRATFSSPYGGDAVARIGLTGSRTWFGNAAGTEVLSYAIGATAHVWVEDQNRNTGTWDTVSVEARSPATGDLETLQLQETTIDSGIFHGTIELGLTLALGDGKLYVTPGSQIEASHQDAGGFTASSAVADVAGSSLEFIDESGQPTSTLLKRSEARLRVFSVYGNTSPTYAEYVTVNLQTRNSYDQETVWLTETGPNTSVFEGSIPMEVGGGIDWNGTLETMIGGYPVYTQDVVTAQFETQTATAQVVGALVSYLDAAGRVTASYVVGETVRVQVTDHDRNDYSTSQESFPVTITSRDGGDSESVAVEETGPDTSVFAGSIPSVLGGGASPNSGQLSALPEDQVEIRYQPEYEPDEIVATAAMKGNSVAFVDAAGQPATVYLESSRAYVRVLSSYANANPSSLETVSVQLLAELSQDTETLTLTETGPNTNVFEGSIALRLTFTGSQAGNGILETIEDGHPQYDPPHQVDTLRATYTDPGGTSVARIGQTGSRTWFGDAAGVEILSYPVGGTARVWVEDQNRNQPGAWDTVYVELRTTGNADMEWLQLLETTRDSGIFTATVELAAGTAQSGDGKLQVVAGSQIEAIHGDSFNATASSAVADVSALSIAFIDETGEPTAELLERGNARVRMFYLDGNSSPYSEQTYLVTVHALRSGDTESLTLTETGPDTGVFEGALPMQMGGGYSGDGFLGTVTSGAPDYLPEEVSASYGDQQATALVLGARVTFLDAYGREAASYAAGEPVRLRVVDYTNNTPDSRNNVQITVISRDGADSETLLLQETGFNTAVFEGALPTSFGGAGSTSDGNLRVYPEDEVEARYVPAYSPIVARVAITGSSVLFVDAAGQPATLYLESSRAYVRVVSSYANSNPSSADTLPVQLLAELSQDNEILTLTETGPSTSVFEGSIALRLVPGTWIAGNGILETIEDGHPVNDPPHEFDTLRATYSDPAGTSVARIGLTGSRTWFADASGQEVLSYALGETAYVRVEDQSRNQPGVWDTVYVEVRSLANGDVEQVQLLETTRDSGVFATALELVNSNGAQSGDGKVQVVLGYQIEATHLDAFGATASSAVADIAGTSITFLDENGEPTSELLERGEARVRVLSVYSNTDPYTVQTRTITVLTLRSGETESLTVTETGPDTSVFEGSLPMQMGGGASGDGVLGTISSGWPEYLPEEVTAEYGGAQATALVLGARVTFVDAYGREAASYAAGEPVRVRVVDHTNNTPDSKNTVQITVVSRDGADSETLSLQETGFNTAVFEGALPTTFGGAGGASDGNLRVYPEDEVEARYVPLYTPIVARASITGNAVLFIDAAGQPATVYLESSRAWVRVTSTYANSNPGTVETLPVQLLAELSQDNEILTLTETGPSTSVFEGSIALRLVPGTWIAGNGILETVEDGHPVNDPPHELDTLRATFSDPSGTSVGRIGLTGSRTWFGDAAGQEVQSYAVGTTAWVWVEDQNRNQPGVWDTVYVEVRSQGNGDLEQVQLLETTRDSGVFRIALDLVSASAVNGDGTLQIMTGYPIEATHLDAWGATSSTAQAGTTNLSITFIDENGEPTTELLERDEARVRMFALYANFNPYTADTQTVTLQALRSGETESLTLTETGPSTGVFEGALPLQMGGGASGDGVLGTINSGWPEYLPEEVTAVSGDQRATALVLGARVTFIDAYGREAASYAAGEPVRVRVVNHTNNTPDTRNSVQITIVSRDGADSETLSLQETGFNTAVFEGTLPTTFGGAGSASDGNLRVYPQDEVEARYVPVYTPIVARASITGNAVLFIDAAGQPATVYLESSRAYVRVMSTPANTNAATVETVPVQLRAELSQDDEVLTLTETGPNTSVFDGSIPLRLVPGTYISGNGILETTEDGHPVNDPPHELDTLRATYSDPSGTSVARIGLTGSRTWFGDAAGQEVASYPAGGTAWIWVEDQNRNQPGVWDTVYVEVRSLGNGDLEQVQLLETTRDSGVFRIALELVGSGAVQNGDGTLQIMTGYPITATHLDAWGATSSTAQAGTTNLSITFIDETGEPTTELLERGDARVRMFALYANFDPYTADTQTVTLQALRSGETESLTLTETGPSTGVFEGALPLQMGGGASGDGVLGTINSGSPEYLPEEVSAVSGDQRATALVLGARVTFIDAYGREAASSAAGEPVRVRVVDHTNNTSDTRNNVQITIVSRDGADSETLSLQETGFDTAVFEGTLPTTFGGAGSASDGNLRVYPEDEVEARYVPLYTPIVARLSITGNAVLFIDAAGQPATVYLESSRAYVRVMSTSANTNGATVETLPVQLLAELSQDDEILTLTETGPNTSVFEGSIPLRLVPGTYISGNGILETTEDGHPVNDPPHELDTLRATYSDPSGTSVARIGLTGSRTWFGDAAGQEVASYPAGGTAWIWVEDQNRNQPGVWDTVYVEVRSLGNGDLEQVQLLETTRDSGVFKIALELVGSGAVQNGDGTLQIMTGYPITATHLDAWGATSSTAQAGTTNLSITFIDETGEPTTELLERGDARVRMFALYANFDPYTADTQTVTLQALRSGETESLTLTETGPSTGVFEGALPLQMGGGASGDGVLGTINSGWPEYLPEEVTAVSGDQRATALVLGARVTFIDAYGREAASSAAGEPVRVRVVDHTNNTPDTRNNVQITVVSRDGADSETLNLQETGFNTAVFEGTLPTTFGGAGTASDGNLRVYPEDEVEARYVPLYTPIVARLSITGNAVLFIDAAGQPATVYLESSRAYVRVMSTSANTNAATAETLPVQLRAELSQDDEILSLTETGPNTSVFEGSIPMRLAPGTYISGNGILETTEDGHPVNDPPHEFDTLRATYSDPSGTSVARIGLTGSRTWFGDAMGQEVPSYAVGTTAHVWVEDQNRNQPGVRDLAYVEVRSLGNSEQEQVVLWETTRDSGIFVGPLALTSSATLSYDEKLMVMQGYQIEAVYLDAYGATASSAVADITDLSITFIDETGEPTTELLERGDARVRMFSLSGNSDPNTVETRSVTLRALRSGETESLTLTETGRNTGVFEGALPLQMGGGASGDGVLGTLNSGAPEYLPEQVTAEYGDQQATALVLGARVTFIDAYGGETASSAAGEPVRVRVVDHTNNTPATRNSVQVTVVSRDGADSETLVLQETGLDTAVFEGTLPTTFGGAGSASDGNLRVYPDDEVEAHYVPLYTPIVARLAITGNAVLFVDAAGQPAPIYLESSRAYVRVVSTNANTNPSSVETVPVQLLGELSQDAESLTLTETGPNTAVFEGSIPMRLVFGTQQSGNGILETIELGHPRYAQPHEVDTVRATYSDPSGTSVARIGLTGSRVWFTNAAGQEVSSYPRFGTVHVRVEDQNRNQPGIQDNYWVGLTAPSGDFELVEVLEIDLDSGIFAGSLPLGSDDGPESMDGVLGTDVGDQIEARANHYYTSYTYSSAFAVITAAGVEFIDETGAVTQVLLEGGQARVRVFDRWNNQTLSPDTLTVQLQAAQSGDVESLTLTETGGSTNLFEGSIPMSVGSALSSNGTLQTINSGSPEYLPDVVTALFSSVYGSASGTATVQPSRVDFVNLRGQIVSTYPLGSTVRVRVTDHNGNADPGQAETFPLQVHSQASNDTEEITLTETGPATGVFEGSVPSTGTGTAGADGVLVAPPGLVDTQHGNASTPDVTSALVTILSTSAPTAVDDTATVVEDDTVLIAVLANDTGTGPLTLGSVTQPAHGSLVAWEDHKVTYTPVAGYVGPDTFTYLLVDAEGGEDVGTVQVTVTPANQAPTPAYDVATTPEDQPVVISVLANDTDPNNDPLRVVVVTQPAAGGTVVINPDEATVTYTPVPNATGEVIFQYTVRDPGGLEATSAVTVTITPVNDPPVANDDTASTPEDTAVTIDAGANDTDIDSATYYPASVTTPANGTAVIDTGVIIYTPNPNFTGTDTFDYTLQDDAGATDTATVTITVGSVNDAPVANADSATVAEDGSVSITVLSNDTDPENDTLDVTAVTQGTNGTVVLNANDTVTYTPNANFSGTDSFTYTISDGNGGMATGTVTVTITGENDSPTANADSATVAEDGSVSITVLTNDTDPENDTLDVTAVTQGTNGTIVLNANDTVTYTPNANFHGTDSFTYTISDGNGGTASATVSVTVTSVNDEPVANADSASAAENGSVIITVLGNDTDADNDSLTVTAVTQGANGTVAINPNNTVTYTPAAGYVGSDTFTYTISDGNGGTSTASVSVTVNNVNDAPAANPDAAALAEDTSATIAVLGNDTDPDNDVLSVASVTQGAYGSVTINPNQTVTYTPVANYSGSDSFTYTASDGNGGTATATVSVTITSVNDAPVAVNDTASTVAETLVVVSVLDNDVDIDGPSLAIASATQPAHGTVTVNANQTIDYTPASAYVGADSFTYTVTDGAGGTATATVNVTVNAPTRVTTNLQVLYELEEGSGTTVTDTSGVGTPLNLTIGSAAAVSWISGGLSVNSATLIQSAGAATKVISASQSTNAITIEAWIEPTSTSQTGPIATVSQQSNKQDFSLNQNGNRWNGTLRTTNTNQGGSTLSSAAGTATLNFTHVVYTRDASGAVRIYVNGVQSASTTLAGNFSSWTSTYKLGLVSELSSGSPWRGKLYLVAIYNRALASTEVRQNWLAGE